MLTNFPQGIFASPNLGAQLSTMFASGNVYFVDGDNGNDGFDGLSPSTPKLSVTGAIADMSLGGVIYVRNKKVAAGTTSPSVYAETFILPAAKPNVTIIGVGNGVKGGQPTFKKGSGSTAHITVRAPGCSLINLSVDGTGATGGGLTLDDDGSTKTAFGTLISNCFFNNNQGSGAASTGGAIQWSATGGAANTIISNCEFMDNRAGIMALGTSGVNSGGMSNVRVEDCVFGSTNSINVDCDIYATTNFNGIYISRCRFTTLGVPAYATSQTAARYLMLTGSTGILTGCMFAVTTSTTFGAAGTGALIPTTVRMAANYAEAVLAGAVSGGEILRT